MSACCLLHKARSCVQVNVHCTSSIAPGGPGDDLHTMFGLATSGFVAIAGCIRPRALHIGAPVAVKNTICHSIASELSTCRQQHCTIHATVSTKRSQSRSLTRNNAAASITLSFSCVVEGNAPGCTFALCSTSGLAVVSAGKEL